MLLFNSLRIRIFGLGVCLSVLVACNDKRDKTLSADILVRNNFESLASWMGTDSTSSLTDEKAHSGRYSIKIDSNNEYSLGFNSTLGALCDVRIKRIRVSGWVFVPNKKATALLITHIGDAIPNTKPLLWNGFDVVNEVKGKYGQWVQIHKVLNIPETADADANIGFFLWRNNISDQPVYFDDLIVTVEPVTS